MKGLIALLLTLLFSVPGFSLKAYLLEIEEVTESSFGRMSTKVMEYVTEKGIIQEKIQSQGNKMTTLMVLSPGGF
jgi:hypothetical protein